MLYVISTHDLSIFKNLIKNLESTESPVTHIFRILAVFLGQMGPRGEDPRWPLSSPGWLAFLVLDSYLEPTLARVGGTAPQAGIGGDCNLEADGPRGPFPYLPNTTS